MRPRPSAALVLIVVLAGALALLLRARLQPAAPSAEPGPIALATFTPLPFELGAYPFPAQAIPTLAPNPTMMAMDLDELAAAVARSAERSRYAFGAIGNVTVVTRTEIYPEDARRLGVTAEQVARDQSPDVAVVVQGELYRGDVDWTREHGTPEAESSGFRRYAFALFVVDRGFGSYARHMANDLDLLLEKLPSSEEERQLR